MPETLQPPLTNDELAQHLEYQVDLHNEEHLEPGHYDPSSINYDPRVALEGTSLAWMQEKAEDPTTPALVRHHETTGAHELSTERLLVDADELESWVGSDLGELRKAIKDPQMARRRVAESLTGEESGSVFSSEPLTRQEVHDYINIGIPRPEDESEAAMHGLSLRVVDELVNTWEHEAEMGVLRGALDRSGGKITWGESGIDGQRSLDQHLFREKGRVLANFHEVHQENVRRLGEDALDAAGVRLRISEQSGSPGGSANMVEQQATQAALETVGSGPAPGPERSATTHIPETAEQDRNAELFTQIAEYTHGRTQLRTDILTGFRAIGDGLSHDRSLTDIPHEIVRELEGDKDWHKHPNEAVSFMETEDGTVQFNYKFKYSVPSYNNGEMGGKLPRYTAWAGSRSGQEVSLGVKLPKAMADTLQEAIRKNPASVRALVEQLALENNDGSLTREAWEHGNTSKQLSRENPIRPPYEALPSDWTITMITGQLTSGRPKYTADRLSLAV